MFVKLSEEPYYYTRVFNFKLKKKTIKSFSFKNWLVKPLWSVHTVETRLSCSEKVTRRYYTNFYAKLITFAIFPSIVSGMS